MSVKSLVKDRLTKIEMLINNRISYEGKIGEMCSHAIASGRRLRPAMVFLACESVGGDSEKVILPAMAIELLHKYSLVHDDIIDRDRFRRGKLTTYARFGSDLAIVIGDLILATAFDVMGDLTQLFPPEQVCICMKYFSDAHKALCLGQVRDMLLSKQRDATQDEYIKMVKLKTGALPSAGMMIGAYLGGGELNEIRLLSEYGTNLGVAFQIQNDLNNLIGIEEKLGRKTGSDIVEGKSTLMVIHTLHNSTEPQVRHILETLGNPEATDIDILKAIRIMQETGSFEEARKITQDYRQRAKDCIKKLKVSEARGLLMDLVDLATNPDYYLATDDARSKARVAP